jgi:hypothetical protein
LDKFTGKEGLFENSPFDERTRLIISKTKTPLGILIDKDLKKVENVTIPIMSIGDAFLFDYAERLIFNNNTKVTIVENNNQRKNNFIIENAVAGLKLKYANNLQLVDYGKLNKPFLEKQDLVLVSLESWKNLVNEEEAWLSDIPSALILKS